MTLMFIVQPISSFGDLICDELISEEAGRRQWQTLEFAVAWVNYSGARTIEKAAQRFLAEGGRIHAIVGLDFGSTTYEGLGNLLDLEGGGADLTTHVFCDENPACTFHPKVFLFSNAKRACLFVGSNNMTGGGLGTNVEAALRIEGVVDDETIRAARQTLVAWRDDRSDSRTRRLTRELLEQLRDRRYVLTELELRKRRKSASTSRSSHGEPLFGRSRTRPSRLRREPSGKGSRGRRASGSSLGNVLLMRVRPRRDGTQFQISMTVHKSFMNSTTAVVSAADGSSRGVGHDHVTRNGKRVPNIARFEAPELERMSNPVARFQWVDADESRRKAGRVLQYEIFDADIVGEGARIFRTLKSGIGTPPMTNLAHLSLERTVLSKSDRTRAQWYRLDSA